MCFCAQEYMPLPPEDAADSTGDAEPEFEFTKVESLLFAFHTVGSQVPEYLSDNPERLKDFRVKSYTRGHRF